MKESLFNVQAFLNARHTKSVRVGLALSVFLLLLMVDCLAAEPNIAAVREELQTRIRGGLSIQPGAVCGVYATSRCGSLLGLNVDPKDYFTTTYVSKSKGSTPSDIVAMANEMGADAVPLANLSLADLSASGDPFVISVRSTAASNVFDHWVCVMPSADGYVAYDGPDEGSIIAGAELLSVWNGYGVLVSKHSWNSIFIVYLQRIAFGVALATSAFFLWRTFSFMKMKRWLATTMIVFAVGAMGNILLSAPTQTYGVLKTICKTGPDQIKSAGLQNLKDAIDRSSRLAIDARLRDTVRALPVPNTINLPVDASLMNLRRLLLDIPRDTPLLVFCQSEACDFDDEVALKLVALGFIDVAACSAGWMEYTQSMEENDALTVVGGSLPK